MERSAIQKLLDLNRRFYEERGAGFAATRKTLHPGMERALAELGRGKGLLDVGCGHGRVARAWKEGLLPPGYSWYVGVEQSRALLDLAPPEEEKTRFLQADLASPGWSAPIRSMGFPLDRAVCFSVLHHVPGREKREDLAREIRSLLPRGGKFAVSVWQFLHVPALASKVRPWSEIGLAGEDLEPGDLLYPWGGGAGEALRYVHHFREEELLDLLEKTGFRPLLVFRSDGRTGDLGLYVLAETK